jgi:hypothetical protein
MTVTVGIPTTGERPVLRRTVEAAIRSASLVSADAVVLVVVNGRGDAPGLGRIDSPQLRVVYLDRSNRAAARNYAIAHGRHDTVLFADDDAVVPQQWCGELHGALRDRGWALVTAPVQVPESGPITALFNYQRLFDSQPPGPDGPGNLITANFGLRRDLIPAQVRFDENLPSGEDTDLGHQLWAAGVGFGFLSDAEPIRHVLPEQLEPNIRRSMAYGQNTAMVSTKLGTGRKLLPLLCSRYAAITSREYRDFRKFAEFIRPDVRAAFTVYEYLFNSAYLVSCLHWLGTFAGQPVIRLDEGQLTAAWRHAAARADGHVSALRPADWSSLAVDYSRLAGGAAAPPRLDDLAESTVADMKLALGQHAPLIGGRSSSEDTFAAGQPAGPGRAGIGRGWAAALGQPGTEARLHLALDELRRQDRPISKADIDSFIRAARMPFKISCEIIEKNLASRE